MDFKIDQGYLKYDIRGNGMPLLFIHGYPLSRRIWDSQLDGLSDIATIIALDLRGHGESFPFEGNYSIDLLADDCIEVLKDLHIPSPIVVCGLSMGGYVTLALYRRNPQLFKAMILTSTRPGPDTEAGKASRDASIKNVKEHGAHYIAVNMIQKILSPVTSKSKPELVTKVKSMMASTSVQGIIGALQAMKNRSDSTPLLPMISCPTLIIHGQDDQLIPIEEAELMYEKIPNSKLVKLSAAGHLPCLEQPGEFNMAIRNFLKSLD